MIPFWNWFFRTLFGVFLWPLTKLKVEGRQYLPSGPFILVAGSHTTELEPGFIAIWLRRQMRFYAKQEIWKNRFMGLLMDLTGQIPVSRSGVREDAESATTKAVDVLRTGSVLGVFPEGTRSRDGMVHAGHPSFVYVAAEYGHDVPIVPVGLVDMRRCFKWKKGAARIVIGEPLTVRQITRELGLPSERIEARTALAVTAYVMRRIAALSGKEYSPKRLATGSRRDGS